MSTYTDGFPGTSLNAEWVEVGLSDTPTVSGGSLSLPPGGPVGAFSIRTNTDFSDAAGVTVRVLIDVAGDTGDQVFVGACDAVGTANVAAFYFPAAGTLYAFDGDGGFDADSTVGALTGRYVMELVADPTGDTVASIYPEGSSTAIHSATVATSGVGAAMLIGGDCHGVVGGSASATASYDDFSITTGGGGGVDPPTPAVATGSGLTFYITTLRYPEVEPVVLHRLVQTWDGEVGIPINDTRDARVTISIYDDACDDILPLERMLFVRYLGDPVFWGPITDPEWDVTNGTVTINALGPDYRAERHYVRVGDEIGGDTITVSQPEVDCPVDSNGMWDVLLTAYNTAGQTARGVPDLGIGRGSHWDSGTTQKIKVARGDETLAKIVQISKSLLGPDFEFKPQEIDQGFYALFNTYEKQGTDRSATVKWQYNWGQENLSGYKETPSGSSVVTHRHTLSSDGKNRGTAAAEGPSARFGVYVDWDAISGNPVGDDDDEKDAVLAGLGEGTVLAYGEPPPYIDVELKVSEDGAPSFKFGTHYGIGDIVEVSAHKGKYRRKWDARITKVTLAQTNSSRATQAKIELVPSILTADDVTGSEE